MMTGRPAESRDDARRTSPFAELALQVKRAVDASLRASLDEAVASVTPHGDDARAAIDAVRSLALRGGKRLRPVLVACAFDACERDGETRGVRELHPAVVLAGAAIELLQTYLLIHDDWMDGDDVRRGGPSVHAMLRTTYGDVHAGDACAILAGDYASALAQEAIAAMPIPAERIVEAMRVFVHVQREVITGQLMDLRGAGGVEAMHDLKTGSYTVRGPLAIGAILAGASEEQRAALRRFAAPLGVAFQLRDDLLGTFGDPATTGKSAGGDLRSAKRTALVAEMRASGDAVGEALFARMGVHAEDADVARLALHLETSGTRARVEARLRELLSEAKRAVSSAPLSARGKALLEGAVNALGERES